MRQILLSSLVTALFCHATFAQESPVLLEQAALNGKRDIDAIALSPDGSLLAVAHVSSDVVVWNIQKQKVEFVLTDAEHGIGRIVFSRDGTKIHAIGRAGDNGSMALMTWEIATKKFHRSLLRVGEVWDYSWEHQMLVSSALETKNKTAHVLHVKNNTGWSFPAHRDILHHLHLSHDAKMTVAFTSGEKPITVWDNKGKKLLHELALKGQFEQGQSVTISADGKRMALVGFPSHLHMRVIDLDKGQLIGEPWVGGAMPLAFLSEGTHLVVRRSGGADSEGRRIQPGLRVWDVEKRKPILTLSGVTNGKLAVSADGDYVALAASDGRISVWRLPDLRKRNP